MVNPVQNSPPSSLFSSINAANNSAASSPAAATSTTSSTSTSSTQDTFLKLLVTQMQNQDPMNPMDNAQITSQMAQLSTVNGINQLNTTLQALSSSMTSSQSMQAASMIGHGVMTPGNTVTLANGSGIGGFNLSQSAGNVQVAITDASGNPVTTLQLGAMGAGVQSWQWNGTDATGANVPAGTYNFSVNATQGANNITATALTYGVVNGVTPGASGTSLNVGANGLIPITQVQQIL